MRRASLIAVALGGCMRIYPDPELPDIKVTWLPEDCRVGTGDVVLSAIGLDDPTLHSELSVACTDTNATFVDVARQRFRVEGRLLDTDGQLFTYAEENVDLRDGLNHTAGLYLGAFANLRAAWTFDMGASCASLGASEVVLELLQGGDVTFGFGVPCELPQYLGSVPSGTYQVDARALAGTTTVAISPPSPDITIDDVTLSNAGTLVMSPCGASCPP